MFDPYPYQIRLFEALMNGENIILVIPTGGGKTLGAYYPFFQNLAYGDGLLPEKMFHIVPMRVLATQALATCRALREQLDSRLFQKLASAYSVFMPDFLSIQTGESPDDPQCEALAIACTVDQALASFLGVPYSLGAKKGNLNVGAICSSYLILDEPHLYPLSDEGRSYEGAFTTSLELLRLTKGLTRFVFMSATMSSTLVQRLSTLLDAVIITVNDEIVDETGTTELEQLNKGRSRIFERSPLPMSTKDIIQQHDRCSLVICNTVQRAQETYLHLSQAIQQQGRAIELRLLHSRFTDEDRKRQGEELSQLLGKEQWRDGLYQGERSIIVVATQVVEVGLDISVQILHTELAPANSLIQRAGRCARFDKQQGLVKIYPLPLDKEGKPTSPLPYSDQLCDATWQALEHVSGRVVGFREEQQLVNSVHTADDLALLTRYEDHRDDIRRDITTCLQTSKRENVGDLIRDITQVQVAIHNSPDVDMTVKPWRWQKFSLYPSAFMHKHWERLRSSQAEHDLKWLCQQPILTPKEAQKQADEEDERLPVRYTWQPIANPDEIPSALMLVLPNQLATYDKDLGFVFLDGRLNLPPEWRQRLIAQNYQSPCLTNQPDRRDNLPTRAQSYVQHIGGLADAYYKAIYHELTYAMQQLELAMHLEPGTIDHAIQLALATHDLGKLDLRWQRWARSWQRFLYEKEKWALVGYKEPSRTYFFAKTNYNYQSREQRAWQKELQEKKPHHACESVIAGRKLIMHSLGVNNPQSPNIPVVRAIASAIAHHHTSTAHDYGATTIHPSARPAIEKALDVVRRNNNWSYDLDRLNLTFEQGDLFPENASQGLFTLPNVSAGPEKLAETWLAFLIVRALRLADQRADLYAF